MNQRMKKTEERISYQKTQKKNETEEKNIKTKKNQNDKSGYNQWTRMYSRERITQEYSAPTKEVLARLNFLHEIMLFIT